MKTSWCNGLFVGLVAQLAAGEKVHTIQYKKPLRPLVEANLILNPATGKKEFTLHVDALTVNHTNGGMVYKTRAYNGLLPGPTIRADPGDELVVTVDNRLSTYMNDIGPHNAFNHLNDTNLHTHGLHIGPDQDK